MSYNDGIRTATTGLNIADSAKAGGVARLNYETGVNPNDLGNAGTIAQGLMDWANKGGEAAMARKQNEEVNKRIKAAEEKKAQEDLELKNKADAKRIYSASGGQSLTDLQTGDTLPVWTPAGEDKGLTKEGLNNANAGLRKEYELLYTNDKVKEEQAFINENSVNIVDKLYEEFENLPADDPARTDFLSFASTNITNLKEKRHYENLSGLKHLGEVGGPTGPIDYTSLQDALADKQAYHIKESQDAYLDNRITMHINGSGVPKSVGELNTLVNVWKGKKIGPDGEQKDLIPRAQVQTVYIEHLTEKLQYARKNGHSSDPIFDSLEMFSNPAKANELFDRGQGMGEKWMGYFNEAHEAREHLRQKETKEKKDAETEGVAVAEKMSSLATSTVQNLDFKAKSGEPISMDDYTFAVEAYQAQRGNFAIAKDDSYGTGLTTLLGIKKSVDPNSKAFVPPEGSEEAKILPEYQQFLDNEENKITSVQAVDDEQSKIIQSDEPAWAKIGKLAALKVHRTRIVDLAKDTKDDPVDQKRYIKNLGTLQKQVNTAVAQCKAGSTEACEMAHNFMQYSPDDNSMGAKQHEQYRTLIATAQKDLLTHGAGLQQKVITKQVHDIVAKMGGENPISFEEAKTQFDSLENVSATDMTLFQNGTKDFIKAEVDNKGVEFGLNLEANLSKETDLTKLNTTINKELENPKLGFNARKSLLKFKAKRNLELTKAIEVDKEKDRSDLSQRSLNNFRTDFSLLKSSEELKKVLKKVEKSKILTADHVSEGQKELRGLIEKVEAEEIKVASGNKEVDINKKLLEFPTNPTASELATLQKQSESIKDPTIRSRVQSTIRLYGDKTKNKKELDAKLAVEQKIRSKVNLRMSGINKDITTMIEKASQIGGDPTKEMQNLLDYRNALKDDPNFQTLMAKDPDNINWIDPIDDAYATIAGKQTDASKSETAKLNLKQHTNSLETREKQTEAIYTKLYELEQAAENGNYSEIKFQEVLDNLSSKGSDLFDKDGSSSNPALLKPSVQDQLRLRAAVAKTISGHGKTAIKETDPLVLTKMEATINNIRNAENRTEKNRLIQEAQNYIMSNFSGQNAAGEPLRKTLAHEDYKEFNRRINGLRPDEPTLSDPRTHGLEIINSIFSGGIDSSGNAISGLPLGEGSVLRNDFRTYYTTEWNSNADKFKKPYSIVSDPTRPNQVKVVGCDTPDGNTCLDDGGLTYAQDLARSLINVSEQHPLGSMDVKEVTGPDGKIQTEGRISINSRLNKFKSTWMENLQRHGFQHRSSMKSANISKDNVNTWSLIGDVNILNFSSTDEGKEG